MPNQQFIDHVAAALPHLTHPGDDNTPPFAVQLPGLAVAGMPPAMAAPVMSLGNWRCAPSCSALSAPPGSAARPRAACSCTPAATTN